MATEVPGTASSLADGSPAAIRVAKSLIVAADLSSGDEGVDVAGDDDGAVSVAFDMDTDTEGGLGGDDVVETAAGSELQPTILNNATHALIPRRNHSGT